MKRNDFFNKVGPYILTLVLLSAIFSCEKKTDSHEYKLLKKERDSLVNIINEINDKYIFDSVKVKTVANPENSLFPNSEYKMEFYFVGYNNDSYFVDYDSIVDGEKIIIDTLNPKKGIIHYKKTLKEGENKIEGFIHTNSKYGKSIQGVLYDVIKTKSE